MKVFVARTVEQARKYTEAIYARYVVVLAGHNAPSGGFARPPAQPTLGYAQLHFATPVARFEGVAIGKGTEGHGLTRLELVEKPGIQTIPFREQVYVDERRLPCVVELTENPEREHGSAQWFVAHLAYLGSEPPPASDTSRVEAADVGSLPEPDLDPSAHEQDRRSSSSGLDAFALLAADPTDAAGSEGDGGE